MKTIFVLLAAMLALAYVPTAAADGGAYAYVAGECYNASGTEGGNDAVGINEEGELMLLGGGDPNEQLPGGHGAVPALLHFGTQTAQDGQGGTACKANGTGPNGYQNRGDTDHLQVTAGYGDAVRVTVCYDGSAHFDDGFCPPQGNK